MTTVKAKIYRDNGFPDEMFVLVDQGRVLLPVFKYQLSKAHRSLSWHRQLLHSTRLLFEFAEANPSLCKVPRDAFREFSWRLISGTIDEEGHDPAQLFWKPRRLIDAQKISNSLSSLFDFLGETTGEPINPKRIANRFEQLLNFAAWNKRHGQDFLGHLNSPGTAWARCGFVRRIKTPNPPSAALSDVKAFPADRFHELLFKGFETQPHETSALGRLNVRDALILLLLHGGGLRVSEPFHLWIDDVRADGDCALVCIGHPTEERVRWNDHGIIKTTSRAEYLARHGWTARNRVLGPLHAGWKNPALDRKWHLEVHWSDLAYSRLFLTLWKIYLLRIAKLERNHPWAWVSLRGADIGQPYKLSKFHRAHERAIQRVGMSALESGGHSPHSHRHAYANRLIALGVSPKTLKSCLHHNALSSQLIYTSATLGEIHADLARARASLPMAHFEPVVS